MEPYKLDLDDLNVTSFAPADGEASFLLVVGPMHCTGCDSGCGIMSGDTSMYC